MDSESCLVLHTPLGAGSDVVARSGRQKASSRGPEMALGYSNIICHFPWLIVLLIVPPQDFL